MKNKRIVCVVVENDDAAFGVLDGAKFTDRLARTLKAFEFTDAGVRTVVQVLFGNEDVPIGFEQPEDE